MSREIENYKDKITELEDKQLILMEQLENEQKNELKLKEEINNNSKTIQQEIAILKKQETELIAKAAEIQKTRDEIAKSVPPEIYERYQRIITAKKDYAVAPIENGACGVCHMKLPPHIIHETRKAENIIFCSYCGRMLFWQAHPV